MPPVVLALWPLALTCLQAFVSYMVGRGVFESLLLVGVRRYCKKWPNAKVIELAIAWADAVGKRHLLGDLQVPSDSPSEPARPVDRGQGGFTTGAFVAVLCIIGSCLLIGYAAGVQHAKGEPVVIVAKAAEALPGGGLKLATLPTDNAEPAQPVAQGSEVAAVGQIKVKPRPVPKQGEGGKEVAPAKEGATEGLCACSEIIIDYTQTLDEDGQPGMQISADGGQITGGHHSPIIGPVKSRPLSWALGVSRGLTGRSGDWGIAVDHDWPAVRGSVDLFQVGRDVGGRVGVLLRF